MSFSKRLQAKAAVIGVLKSAKYVESDFAISSTFNPKLIAVKCPKCDGYGMKDDGMNCPMCGGRGAVKLSQKAINRMAKKMVTNERTQGNDSPATPSPVEVPTL